MKLNNKNAHNILLNIFTKLFKIKTKKVDSINHDKISDWDSLKHILLIQEVENKFKLKVKDFDIAELTSFNNILKYIKKKKKIKF